MTVGLEMLMAGLIEKVMGTMSGEHKKIRRLVKRFAIPALVKYLLMRPRQYLVKARI